MQFLTNGKILFDDIYEMYYHLFSEIGLAINSDQYLYDQDSMTLLRYKDNFIKATVQPIEIYSGKNDIVFDPVRNYNLMVNLFGYFISKESNSIEGDKIRFISQYIDDNQTKDKQRLVVKTANGDFASQFYYNIYLAYIECIFLLSGNFTPDLGNFDFVEV